MSTTLSAAQRLKFQLLAEGIEISRLARKALREATSQSDLTPADYASTTGLILELDDDVWVNAPINDHNPNFVSGSRFVLDYGVDGLSRARRRAGQHRPGSGRRRAITGNRNGSARSTTSS